MSHPSCIPDKYILTARQALCVGKLENSEELTKLHYVLLSGEPTLDLPWLALIGGENCASAQPTPGVFFKK
jgi:hypothetical protein